MYRRKCFVNCSMSEKQYTYCIFLPWIVPVSTGTSELLSVFSRRTPWASQESVCFKWAINRIQDLIELLSSSWLVLMAESTWPELVNSEQQELWAPQSLRQNKTSWNPDRECSCAWLVSQFVWCPAVLLCLRGLPQGINEGERLGMECWVRCWVNSVANASGHSY